MVNAAPSRSWNAVTSGAGTVLAPDERCFSDDRSVEAKLGCSNIEMSMVGTVDIPSHRYVSINSNTSAGSNDSTSTCVPRLDTAPTTQSRQPPAWNIGIVVSHTQAVGHLHEIQRVGGVVDHAAVMQERPLREPRRARRVLDHGWIAGIDGRQRRW